MQSRVNRDCAVWALRAKGDSVLLMQRAQDGARNGIVIAPEAGDEQSVRMSGEDIAGVEFDHKRLMIRTRKLRDIEKAG